MDFGTWYAHATRRADLHLRERVQTLMQGMHGSTFRGRGEDFEFFQPHALGEDTAHIDWKASERLEDGLLQVDAIADAYWTLHTQHPSAWTLDLDLRPYRETF